MEPFRKFVSALARRFFGSLFIVAARIRVFFRITANLGMIVAAMVVGVMAGFSAILFRYLIALVQTAATLDPHALAESVAGLPWYGKLLIPCVGGALTGLLVRFLAKEVGGPGIPNVMEAVITKHGVIRPRVVPAKLIASALTIGTGGSVGQEGPIAHLGSALGSAVGQYSHVSVEHMRVLVGCGAAGGIAATFNAPIAGVLFAVEIILGRFALTTFSPLVVSSVTATVISRVYLGDVPAFVIPSYTLESAAEMGNFLLLSALVPLVAILFMWLLDRLGRRADALPWPPYVLGGMGGLVVGAIVLVRPEVFGVGYATVSSALRGELALTVAATVLFAKIIATVVTSSSGGSGGVFAPSLFIGATFGSLYGNVAQQLGLTAQPVGSFAVVGMAATVAATTHAPLTMVLMVYEMTGDYALILPLMTGAIVASLLTSRLYEHSIYTQELAMRGIKLDHGLESSIMSQTLVEDLMRMDVPTLRADTLFPEIMALAAREPHHQYYVLGELDELLGVISIYSLNRAMESYRVGDRLCAADLMTEPSMLLQSTETLAASMGKITAKGYDELPVIDHVANRRIFVGVIDEKDVLRLYDREVLHHGSLGVRYVRKEEERVRQDFVEFAESECVDVVKVTATIAGQTLQTLQSRERYNVNVVAIKHRRPDGSLDRVVPNPCEPLRLGDALVVAGLTEDVARFAEAIADKKRKAAS